MKLIKRIIARHSIRTLASLSVCIVILPILVLILAQGWDQYNAIKGETATRAMELARHFSRKNEDVVIHAQTLLGTIATQPGIDSPDPERIVAQFKKLVAAHPQYAYLTLARTDGSLWVSSASRDTSINFSDRFVFKAAMQGKPFTVGQVILSRTTGLSVLPFSTPVLDGANRVVGVLLLGLRVEDYTRYLAGVDIPVGGRFVLFDSTGTRLLRFPGRPESSVGQQLPGWKAIEAASGDSAILTIPDPVGQSVTGAFIKFRLQDSPDAYLGVWVGIPTPMMSDLFWPVAGRALSLLSGVAALAWLANLFITRWAVSGLVALETAAEIAAAGGAIPRMPEDVGGTKEVINLARSLSKMSEALAVHDQARGEMELELKDARRAAELRSAELEAVIDSAPAAIWIARDRECSVMTANPVGYELLRMRPGTNTSMSSDPAGTAHFRVMLAGVELPIDKLPVQRAAREGVEISSFEVDLVFNDDRVATILGNAAPIRDRKGDVTGAVGVFIDVTDHKRVERELSESKRLLDAALSSTTDGVLITDAQGRFIQANKALLDIQRIPANGEKLRGLAECVEQLEVYLPSGERVVTEDLAISRALRGETTRDIEYAMRRKDTGEEWSVSFSVAPLFDDRGGIAGTVAVGRDITERKRLEKALRESQESIEAIFRQSGDSIVVSTFEGVITHVNPTTCTLLGYALEEIVGLRIPDIAPEFGSSGKVAAAGASLPQTFETKAKRKDGSSFSIEVSLTGITYHGEPSILAIGRDLTQKRELEELKEHVERMARHDLRNPLASMVSIPKVLLMSENLDPDERKLLVKLKEGGYRLLDIIELPITFFKMEQGSYKLDSHPVEVLKETVAVIDHMKQLYKGKKIQWEIMLDGRVVAPEDEFMVDCELLLFSNLLTNLLDNAQHASPEDAVLRLEFTHSPAVLRIVNKGEVPEEIRDRFFEKYVTVGKKHGTGLGTYSAALIARTHGWEIKVDCSVPGETTLEIGFEDPTG